MQKVKFYSNVLKNLRMIKMPNFGNGVGQGGLYWNNKKLRKWIKKNIGHPLKTLRDSGEFEEVWGFDVFNLQLI